MTPTQRSAPRGRNRFAPWRGLERQHLVYVGAIVAIALFAIWTIFTALPDQSQPSAEEGPRNDGTNVAERLPDNSAVLFYVAEDGTALVEREVEVPLGETTLAQARIIAERQLSPPEIPLISPFPEGTELHAIYLTPSGNAFVDLSQQVSLAHPGGSLDELFTVYALVNALTRNLLEISAVQILIEGQEVDTLAGHVDLRHPLGLSMKWVSRGDATTLNNFDPAEE